jgi:hypothetical protein
MPFGGYKRSGWGETLEKIPWLGEPMISAISVSSGTERLWLSTPKLGWFVSTLGWICEMHLLGRAMGCFVAWSSKLVPMSLCAHVPTSVDVRDGITSLLRTTGIHRRKHRPSARYNCYGISVLPTPDAAFNQTLSWG